MEGKQKRRKEERKETRKHLLQIWFILGSWDIKTTFIENEFSEHLTSKKTGYDVLITDFEFPLVELTSEPEIRILFAIYRKDQDEEFEGTERQNK